MEADALPSIQAVLDRLKSDGTFDQFRKKCLAAIEEEPSYRAQKEHVEVLSRRFLHDYERKEGMSKNEVRTKLRSSVLDELKKPGVQASHTIEELVENALEAKSPELLKSILDIIETMLHPPEPPTNETSLNTNASTDQSLVTNQQVGVSTSTQPHPPTSSTFELPIDLLALPGLSSGNPKREIAKKPVKQRPKQLESSKEGKIKGSKSDVKEMIGVTKKTEGKSVKEEGEIKIAKVKSQEVSKMSSTELDKLKPADVKPSHVESQSNNSKPILETSSDNSKPNIEASSDNFKPNTDISDNSRPSFESSSKPNIESSSISKHNVETDSDNSKPNIETGSDNSKPNIETGSDNSIPKSESVSNFEDTEERHELEEDKVFEDDNTSLKSPTPETKRSVRRSARLASQGSLEDEQKQNRKRRASVQDSGQEDEVKKTKRSKKDEDIKSIKTSGSKKRVLISTSDSEENEEIDDDESLKTTPSPTTPTGGRRSSNKKAAVPQRRLSSTPPPSKGHKKGRSYSPQVVVTRYNRQVKPNSHRYYPGEQHTESEDELPMEDEQAEAEEEKESEKITQRRSKRSRK